MMIKLAPIALVSLAALAGCAQLQAPQAPIGQTATTGGLICPQGFVPSVDGQRCVAAGDYAEDAEFDVP